MTEDKLEELRDELYNAEIEEFNKKAVIELLQEWCINVSENMMLARQARNIDEMRRSKVRFAVVVGAAPSLADEQIIALRKFKGDIIITNKNYERFLKLGVIPTWVVLLDAHPVSAPQFAWLKDCPWPEEGRSSCEKETKFFVSTTAYPQTVKYIMEFASQESVFMFNPIHDDGTAVRLSKTWEWMNDKTEFDHGGSVGCCAISLTKHLGYTRIGLLGFDLCEMPNPKWSIEETQEREFKYYPDIDKTIAIPMHFKAYMMYIFGLIVDTSWANWYNLGTSPALTHSPILGQKTVKQFVKMASDDVRRFK